MAAKKPTRKKAPAKKKASTPKLKAEGESQTGPVKSALPLVPTGPKVSLDDLAAAAAGCTACPLWKDNTGTVFGEGPQDAKVVLVGEQPAKEEDEQGRPFVGGAGRLLDECLEEAGLDRKRLYLTNAVKHFKHHRQKTRRLHDKPNAAELKACRPWLDAELARLAPQILVALGAIAAKQIFGSKFSITAERGQWRVTEHAVRTLATWHPSAILRTRAIDMERARWMRAQLVEDLRKVKAALDELDEFE